MRKFLRIPVYALVLLCFLNGQAKHPADTVLASDKTSLAEKILISPIALWQRFSYSTPLLACQFYPSCSNYAAQSISEKGVLKGTIMAADRIVRCNPAAYHYHVGDNLKSVSRQEALHTDGRLVDRVQTSLLSQQNGKSPKLAAALSVLIPGSGRIYAGRTWDGFFGFLTFTLSANLAYEHLNSGHTIRGGLFSFATLAFYGGEILGAYKAAQMAPPDN
jgi:putative component of membrane protein insertase Oxa1/YidC/SpoIIIJ protein YidD/TM2 domain-containing membrane protein YozV